MATDKEHSLTVLNNDFLGRLRQSFYTDPKNLLAQNICSRIEPFDVCISRKHLEETQHVFNFKVDEAKPITNQKNSGRCWIFAALNVIRIPFIKHYNLDDFEFSQAYLFFWDKIERCNYFLNNVVEVTRREEAVDGRLMSFLLQDPICDGGQWDMFVNLVKKHGLMPKKNFPESFSCENSLRMNALLKSKLREYAKTLRDLIVSDKNEDEIKATIENMMENIYRIVGICLGIPSESFVWTFYDKNKQFHSVGPISPKEFYENHVKHIFNLDNKVCLVTDPRPSNPYNKSYTIDCLGNVVGGKKIIYNNQEVEMLLNLTAKSIEQNEPVWFGCEVTKRFAGKQGVQDLKVHDFELVFGVDVQITMSKADRLVYGESAMTHAMIFTGIYKEVNRNLPKSDSNVDLKEEKYVKDGEVLRLRVENSWGEERGEKGYLVMSADWFKEFVFEVVVDKKFVDEEVLKVFELEPVVLPAWDPMGTLAE
ncbi:bleomycin hydrolase [Onthophagus taurus]|uniref:bleomycin hydrolase n=1 Tax=Onthophagus taurus TaxID=166361 RepID=UPI0039BE5137